MDIEILAAQIFSSCCAEEVRLLIATLQDGLNAIEAANHPYVRSPFVQEYVGIYDNPDAHRRVAATIVQNGNNIYIYPDHYEEVAV